MTMSARRILVAIAVLVLLLSSSGLACTSFCIQGKDGPVFSGVLEGSFTRGLVFVNARGMEKRGMDSSPTGRVAEWVSAHGSVTFSLAGHQFAWAGMNEVGLAVSTMRDAENSNCTEAIDERPPLGGGQWLQFMLDTCETIDDVRRIPESVRMAANVDHFLVCDRYGGVGVIEFLDGQMILYSGDELPISALTNIPYASACSHRQNEQPQIQSLLWSQYFYARFQSAARAVETWNATSPASPAVSYAFGIQNIMGGVRWGIVYDCGNRRIHFRTYNHRGIREIDLARIDFVCDVDGDWLDVTDPLGGDILDSFKPYTRAASTDQYVFIQGADGDAAAIQQASRIFEYFESFPCTR